MSERNNPYTSGSPTDGPEAGVCPLCARRVSGARLGGVWLPKRGMEHERACRNFASVERYDKCCCGHPRSEHWLDPKAPLVTGEIPKEKENGACAECARMKFGKKCAHFTQSYRIIDTDNFGGDYPNEKVIASGITYKPFADEMCEALIAKFSGNHASRFYKVVEDDYDLQPGFEP
jgi:hypothetical protein